MSEYEVFWLMVFPIIYTQRNNYGNLLKGKQTNIGKNYIVISQSIGIIVIKNKETPTTASVHLEIKYLLEDLQV